MDGVVYDDKNADYMKDIVSKLSLYDILAMVIPGGTILIAITCMLNNLLIINDDLIEKPLFWIIGLSWAYIIGLLNYMFTAVAWRRFRNNEFMIKLSLEKARKYLSTNGKFDRLTNTINISDIDKRRIRNYMFLIKSVLFTYLTFGGLMFIAHCICHKCESKDLSLMLTVPLITILVCAIVELIYFFNNSKDSYPVVLQKYYLAYYFVAKKKYNDDIFIMEGQIAFLQSMILPLILFFFISQGFQSTFLPGISLGSLHLLLALVILTIFFTVFCRQMKIYQRVFEDYEYL